MTVKEFVEGYKKAKINDKTKENFFNKHIIKDYIPYLEKIVICNQIIKTTQHIKNDTIKIFKANSPSMMLMYNIKIVDNYTDIDIEKEINDGMGMDEIYDILTYTGAMIDIYKFIPESELVEFKQLLDMTLEDVYTNEYSVVSSINNILDAIKSISNGFVSGIENTLSNYINAELEGDVND